MDRAEKAEHIEWARKANEAKARKEWLEVVERLVAKVDHAQAELDEFLEDNANPLRWWSMYH